MATKPLKWLWACLSRYWHGGWWHKIVVTVLALGAFSLSTMYGIGLWYQHSQNGKPLELGVSFIPEYASFLGIDPKETMDALINDIGVREFRLTSYWNVVEPKQGQYDFTELDWEFAKAEAADARIILTVGLRQPRWPECHPPDWVDTSRPVGEWQPALEQYMTAVVNRYKNSPALHSYQLENEYFLTGFGNCTDKTRSRLISEYNLLKKLDPAHPIIVGRSNNALGTPIGEPTPDEFSITIYQRVWNTVTHRYVQYPFPSWYYAFLAGVQQATTGRNMMIGELQAEPWPHGVTIPESTLDEHNNTFDAGRLRANVDFAKQTGMREISLWGAEYWYYRAQVLHDPSVWDAARDIFAEANAPTR